MQPTPTRSPTLNLSTPEPILATMPAISCPRYQREDRGAPFLPPGVDVGVADTGKRDLDQHVAGTEVPANDGGLLERGPGGRCRICGDRKHAAVSSFRQ